MATTSRPASTSTSTSTRPTISSPNPNNRASTTTNQTNQSGQTPAPYVVNTQTRVLDSAHGRILCVADIRGRLSAINDLAREAGAHAVIHTGDFGLFESASLDRIHDRTLRHLTMYSPLIPSAQRNHLLSADNPPSTIRSTLTISMLSEFPLLLSGQIKLQVPVYTVAGACEDVLVLERFRTGEYAIENLTVLDEATTRVLDVGGLKLRLLGLGGAFVPHKMFDNGEGNATIAGGGGTVWTTTLQIGELVDTAQRVYDPAETRLLITHASPGREGILSSLALVLKADLTISAGLHFRYATSWNEFSVQGDYEGFRTKLRAGRDAFERVWDSVKGQVDAVIDDHQRVLLDKALSVIERVPPALGTVPPGSNGPAATEEPAWKNCWNWNLCDAAYGSLVLDLREGRVSAELKSQGFNYAYRRSAASGAPATGAAMATGTPGATQMSKAPTPAPGPVQAPSTTSAEPAPAPPPAQKPTTASSTPGSATPATTNGAEKDAQKEAQKAKKKEKKKEKKEAARAGAGAAPSSSDPPKSAGAGGTGGAEGGWGAADGEDPWSESAAAGAGAGAEANAGGEADKPKMVEVEGWGMVEDDDPWAAKSGSASTAQPPQPPQQQAHTPRGWGGGDEGGESLASPSTTGGARTPTGKRPPRNPWTLFMRLPVPASEDEIREFFLEAKAGITKVNIPSSYAGRERKIAYVEFGDEDAMKAALDGHAEKLNDAVPDVKQADREPRDGAGGGGDFRGRGRGRGGRGGYASRAFAQGGLTRGGKPNGNAP